MKIKAYKYHKSLTAIVFFTLLIFTYSCSSDDVVQPVVEQEEEKEPEPEPEVIAPEDKLPLVQINTNGVDIVDEPKIAADIKVTEAENVTYEGFIGVEFRGSSSQMFPKKSLGFETWDENGEDLDTELLGFPEEEDWILYGPYSDKSLMRNMLIMDLAREFGQYASRTKFVELEINESFRGVYVFMEKLKRDGDRIDISKLNDDENSGEDLTGGYILKIDKTTGNNLGEGYNELNSFTSAYAPPAASGGQEIHFLYEYPDAEDITPEQKNYISNYVAQFEDALSSDEFADPEMGYAALIDVPSFIDFFILNEISNNVDGFRLSTFMHKDKNEKLKMGPIWDFNLAFGNANYCSGDQTDVWAYKFNERCSQDNLLIPFWWNRLLEDPTFVSQLKERWSTLRGGVLANASVQARIEGYETTLTKAGAIETNFNAWPIFDEYIWPNSFVGKNYDEEVGFMSGWLDDRLNWLDGAIDGL